MNSKLPLFLFFSIAINLNAQQALEKKIPKQAGFVLSFNLKTLSQKINFNDLGNYNFLKKPENEVYIRPNSVLKELFRLPDKAGISRTGKLFIFPENHDSIHNLSYLIALSNAKAFEDRFIDILKNKQNVPQFNKQGKIRVLNYQHEMTILVAKEYAIISIWDIPNYYANDYYEYNEEKDKVIQLLDSIKYANMPLDFTVEEEIIPDTVSLENVVPEETEQENMDDQATYDSTVMVEEMEFDYDHNYDNDSLMKQFERSWVTKRKLTEEIFWARHDNKMTQQQRKINELKPVDGIAANAEFTKVFANTDDIIYWFHYETYSRQLIDLMSDNYFFYDKDSALLKEKLKNLPPNKLAELMDNNSMYALGNFNKGEIKMNFYNVFNEKLKPYIEKIYSSNINPDFFKYIKSDNLIGLIGFSFNTEAGAELYYEIFRRAYESAAVPRKELIGILEFSDIFLDKNVLHHTLKGDAVVAFTGIKSYLQTYTEYVFDSLTFESRLVEKTKTKYIPEFAAVLTIENLTNVKRILKTVERLERITKLSENVYSSKSRNAEMNGSFFIIIKDNLLFITNDKPLATEQIANGMSLQRTSGDEYKAFLNSGSFGFWDASKMFKLMAEGPDEKFGKPDELEKWSKKINKGFFVAKPLHGNTLNTEISLEMKNRENSSLLELLKLFDDVYVFNNFRF